MLMNGSIIRFFSFRFGRTEITFHAEWYNKAHHCHESNSVTGTQTKHFGSNIFVNVSQWRPFDFIKWCWRIKITIYVVVTMLWCCEMIKFFYSEMRKRERGKCVNLTLLSYLECINAKEMITETDVETRNNEQGTW